MLVCDLDRLKEINDGFGHATGDRVLEATADVLRTRVRAGDHVARLGGDEFAVLCPATDLAAASALAEDLQGARRPAGPARGRDPGRDRLDRGRVPGGRTICRPPIWWCAPTPACTAPSAPGTRSTPTAT